MVSAEFISRRFLKDLENEEKKLEESKKREEEITKRFMESIKKLSLLL